MQTEQLVRMLEDPAEAGDWLRKLGLHDLERGHRNLVGIREAGMVPELLVTICRQLEKILPRVSDADRVLNNLDRFVVATRNPLSLGSLMERDSEALPTLLQIFSASQYFADLLIHDPEGFDLLRLTEGQPIARDILIDDICKEALSTHDSHTIMQAIRRYKQREMLRIAYGDVIRGQRVDVVTQQISYLADGAVEAAVRAAQRQHRERRGAPMREDGREARFVVLALGKLGGAELNYSSDIDLVFLCDDGGQTNGQRPIGNQEYFDRLARTVVKLLTENTELGIAYRVDLRLRPNGDQGPAVTTFDSALRYYDVGGRTWERQAFVKARAIAGDVDLGDEFLKALEPWIYRRYLSRADITGIKALKRRIEQRARREGGDERNVKTGHGGIRDIEFVIQFLQLLNGGDLPEIRTGNTLAAIRRLERAGCLNPQEAALLRDNYEFLRKLEHRLQIMFDFQTHEMPTESNEVRRLAIRMGYPDGEGQSALEAFQRDYSDKTAVNRKILNHVLHEAFGDEQQIDPEVDLVLDPDPPERLVHEALSKYGFRDVLAAYQHLTALATEPIPFLSTRRCRHFLASIAPRLLQAISTTPDPDSTLVNLSRVSDSLGGKGILWELFSSNEPSLQLYVQLCACSPYLSEILTSHPGMVDELMDSLVLDRLPSFSALETDLADLCRGAEDLDPILHSFKNSMHLRVGVRDILGKEDIRDTQLALSDIAEVCLQQITEREYTLLVERYGHPTIGEGPRAGEPCSFIIVAMGKMGGREPNYHSDLDVVFLYEEDGPTRQANARRHDRATTNQHFFCELGQRIIKTATRLGPQGRLYEVDPRLRPTGRNGMLAVSLPEFTRYFEQGQGQLWERQALCKARVVFGSPRARQAAADAIHQALVRQPWRTENVNEIRDMRRRLEQNASPRNLKRGPGGTVDVEFIVQMLQLRHADQHPEVLVPGTLDAIQALRDAGCLNGDDADGLNRSYRFLRSTESGLRLMNTAARHDLPDDPLELRKLAFLLGEQGPQMLVEQCEQFQRQNRETFLRQFETKKGVRTL